MSSNSNLPSTVNFQSNFFALLITILAAITLLSLKSKPILEERTASSKQPLEPAEIHWEIEPNTKPNPRDKKFVEANPNSQINPPDETTNFSFQDQQAAQPTPLITNKLEIFPKLEGEKLSSKVAQPLQDSPLIKSLPHKSESMETQREQEQVKENLTPITKAKNMQIPDKLDQNKNFGLKIEDSEEEGNDRIINLSEKQEHERIKLDPKQVTPLRSSRMNSLSVKPRPKLSPEILRGPVMKTFSSAPRAGIIAVECRLHPYGVYIQEMLRSIEDQWHHLAHGSLSFLQKDKMKTKISYRFTLKADGTITKLSILERVDRSLPAELCRQAIASRVPFGEWTQKMIDDFGQSDEITIHFNYR